MFYYLLAFITLLFLVVAIVAFILCLKGVRFSKTREQQQTEEGLQKTFGKNTRWGLFGGADNEIRHHSSLSDHSSHGHHSDGGGGHDVGGGDGGSGGD